MVQLSLTSPLPVEPNVSMAYSSSSSIFVDSEVFTMGTDLPVWLSAVAKGREGGEC